MQVSTLTSGIEREDSALVESVSARGLWRVEIEFDRSGSYNMARDEAMARSLLADHDAPNVLRLYSWEPYAISLGFQQSDESVDHEVCRLSGIDVVRRPTGGRAVFHANELTYAVVMRTEPSSGIYAVHNAITEALLAGIRTLGPGGEALKLTGADSDIREAYSGEKLTNLACFASSARYEVTWQSRKVLGSAQRRFGDVVLQHGSVPLDGQHKMLGELLKLSSDRREAMARLLDQQTASLSDVFQRKITVEETAQCISAKFVDHICR